MSYIYKEKSIQSLLLVSLIILLTSTIVYAQTDPVNELIQRVNSLRVSYGENTYEVDYSLMYVAQMQAEWSAVNNHIGHDGPGGSSPDDRALAMGYGYGYKSFATENVSIYTTSRHTPAFVVEMWQSDWGHLNAMISSDYEHIGVGYAQGAESSWFIMMVGWIDESKPLSTTSDQENKEIVVPYVPFVISTPDEFGAIYHEVQLGQTAWTIAAKYGIDLEKLYELNNISENSVLYYEDILIIHPPLYSTATPISSLTNNTEIGMLDTSEIITTYSNNATQDDYQSISPRNSLFSILLIAGIGISILILTLIFFQRKNR